MRIENLIGMFVFVIIMMFACTKKITVVETVEQPKPKALMTFKLEEPSPIPEPPPIPMKRFKQCVMVYFKFDSDELQESEKWKIANIEHPVELVGGCCPIGDENYNYTLGIRRAMTIKNFLESNGIKTISYKSVGENKLVSEHKEEYYLNRRCEVLY